MIQNGNATSQNTAGQLPAMKKKGNSAATNGNGTGGNTVGAQTVAPGPALIQNGNAASQNGASQLPLLKKVKGMAPDGTPVVTPERDGDEPYRQPSVAPKDHLPLADTGKRRASLFRPCNSLLFRFSSLICPKNSLFNCVGNSLRNFRNSSDL